MAAGAPPPRDLEPVVRVCGGVAIAIGVAIVLGWALDAGVLTSIVPSLPAATFNTGLMFVGRRRGAGGLAPARPRVRLRRLRVRARVRHPGRGGHRRRPRGGQPARDRLRGDGPSGPPLHAHGRGVRAARGVPARAQVAHAARRLHRRGARRRRRGVGRARGRGLPGRRRLPARPFERTRHVGPHRRRAHLRARRDLRAASARAAGRLVRLRRAGRGRRAQPDGARTGRAVRGRWARSGGRVRRPLQRALRAVGDGRHGGGADPGDDPARRFTRYASTTRPAPAWNARTCRTSSASRR